MENSILYSEINCVCILILTLLAVKVRKSMFIQKQRQLLMTVTITTIIFILLDAVWIFIDNNIFGISITINWLLNGCYYILSGILGYTWFLYAETVQESKLVCRKRYMYIATIPIIVLIIMTLISCKTGWLFYIDENNIYHRGPAYAVQLIFSYGYVIFSAVKSYCMSFRTSDFSKKTNLRILTSFVIPTLISGTMQVVFPGYPILCIGNTFGILYVYLTMQEKLVSVDALTKLNNRNQLFQYLSTRLSHSNANKNMYLLIMDVDYFKSVNDQYGHVEGDRALKLVANVLMKVCSNKHYFASRYGGDEFVMICDTDSDETVEDICNSIHKELENVDTPYKLSLGIGYTRYSPDIKNQQEFIAKADEELYKVKKARRQN